MLRSEKGDLGRPRAAVPRCYRWRWKMQDPEAKRLRLRRDHCTVWYQQLPYYAAHRQAWTSGRTGSGRSGLPFRDGMGRKTHARVTGSMRRKDPMNRRPTKSSDLLHSHDHIILCITSFIQPGKERQNQKLCSVSSARVIPLRSRLRSVSRGFGGLGVRYPRKSIVPGYQLARRLGIRCGNTDTTLLKSSSITAFQTWV